MLFGGKSFLSKKAEMGVGTLILFISLLLIAGVASAVLIQTAGSLQSKALQSGKQIERQMATGIQMVEVTASDGSDGTVEVFNQLLKLNPGSVDIKLDSLLLMVSAEDSGTAELKYRGTTGLFSRDVANGYYTVGAEEALSSVNQTSSDLLEDYDDDGLTDSVSLTTNGYLNFSFSDGESLIVSDFNCTGTTHAINGFVSPTSNEVELITYSGTCGANSTAGATITVEPKNAGKGYFTVQYIQRSTNSVDGNLRVGDVVKIYYEIPQGVATEKIVKASIIPETGMTESISFVTPMIMSSQMEYLYP